MSAVLKEPTIYDPNDPLTSHWADDENSFERVSPKYEREKSESPPIEKTVRPTLERENSSQHRIKKTQSSLADKALLHTLAPNRPDLANEGGGVVLDLESSPEGPNKSRRKPNGDIRDHDQGQTAEERQLGEEDVEDQEEENQAEDLDDYLYRVALRQDKEKKEREKENLGRFVPKVAVGSIDHRDTPLWKLADEKLHAKAEQFDVSEFQSGSSAQYALTKSLNLGDYRDNRSWNLPDEDIPSSIDTKPASKPATSPPALAEFRPAKIPSMATALQTRLQPMERLFPEPLVITSIQSSGSRRMDPPPTAPLPPIRTNHNIHKQESSPNLSKQSFNAIPNGHGGQHKRSLSENKLPRILDLNGGLSSIPLPGSTANGNTTLPSINIFLQQAKEANTNIIREQQQQQQRQRQLSLSSSSGLPQPSPSYILSPHTGAGGAGSPTSSTYLGTSPRQDFGASFSSPSTASLPKHPLPPPIPLGHSRRISINTSTSRADQSPYSATSPTFLNSGSSHASPDGQWSSTEGQTPQTQVTTPSEHGVGVRISTFPPQGYEEHVTSPRTAMEASSMRLSPGHQNHQSAALPIPPIGRRVSIPGEHMEQVHGAVGVYKCKAAGCNAPPFQTQYLLNSHATVHSTERPHFCPEPGCPRGRGGEGFKRKNEMKRHGLVHASPGYECPYCRERDHKYPRPDNLQRHVKVHHPDVDMSDGKLRQVLERRPGGIRGGGRRRRGSGP